MLVCAGASLCVCVCVCVLIVYGQDSAPYKYINYFIDTLISVMGGSAVVF